MKKWIALLLALVMVFAVTACANSASTPAAATDETPAAAETPAAETPAAETPAAPAEGEALSEEDAEPPVKRARSRPTP